MFAGILLHSPSALVCGWDRLQNAEAFSLSPFLDAYFPKCQVHLSGQLYTGFFFSNTPCECPPPPDTAHIVRLAPHWVELELRCWGEVCVFSDRAPQPYAIQMQMSFDILKRRISPGCILMLPPHTLSLSAQGWSLASSHCLTAETFSLGSS